MPLTIYGNVIVGAWQYRLVAITVTTLLPLVVAMAATAFRRPVGEAEPAYLSAAQLVSEG
jgi:hypothetical protein